MKFIETKHCNIGVETFKSNIILARVACREWDKHSADTYLTPEQARELAKQLLSAADSVGADL